MRGAIVPSDLAPLDHPRTRRDGHFGAIHHPPAVLIDLCPVTPFLGQPCQEVADPEGFEVGFEGATDED